MRTRARIDTNQPTIVEAFRKMGCDYLHTHQLGKGYPDGFVAYSGLWMAIEIKAENGKLTEAQEKLYGKLRTHPRLVRSVEEARDTVNVLKGWHRILMGNYEP